MSSQFNLLDENENDFSFINFSPSGSQTSINPFLPKLFNEKDDFSISSGANNYYESLINCTISKLKKNSNAEFFDDFEDKRSNSDQDIFKIEKKDSTKKKIERKLLMNRLSVKKSRQKKKIYLKKLEEESANFKNKISLNNVGNLSDGKNKNFFNHLRLIGLQEKEIREKGQKQCNDIMKQYELLEKTALVELLIKQINLFIPLRFRIFGERYMKLIKFNDDDSLSVISTKIDENLEKINNYMDVVSKERIKSVIKLHEIYNNFKKYVAMFQLMISQNF